MPHWTPQRLTRLFKFLVQRVLRVGTVSDKLLHSALAIPCAMSKPSLVDSERNIQT